MKKNYLSLILMLLLSVSAIQKSHAQLGTFEEGHFYHDSSSGKVYWRAFGKLHHVQSEATLSGLFSNATSSSNMSPLPQVWIANPDQYFGEPLTPDNGLVNNVQTGIVYFRRGNILHRINTPQAFDIYNFKWSAIQNINGISGYSISCSLPWQLPAQTPISGCW